MTYVLIAVAVIAVLAFAVYSLFQPKPLPGTKEPQKLPGPDESNKAAAAKVAGKKPVERQTKDTTTAQQPQVSRPETGPSESAAKAPVKPSPVTGSLDEPRDKPALPTKPVREPEKPRFVEEDFGQAAVFDPATVRKGLARTRGGLIARLSDLIRGRKVVDPSLLAEIEEVLLSSDVGVKTSQTLIQRLHERLKNHELDDEEKVWAALRTEALALLGAGGRIRLRTKPTVVLVVGVNGSGKTTTIGKLAAKLRAQGKSVVLGAGDTFRAAAVQQLEVWGEREEAKVVKGKEGADPGAVLFDAVQAAKEQGADVVLCDTAGRLQNKTNLMEELARVRRTLGKALDGAPHETLLVLDATNGQNALQQARLFKETIELTGVVLTKLDGTAKGGVVLAIADELGLPVRYIGIGERSADLREFDPAEFVEALFAGRDSLSNEAA